MSKFDYGDAVACGDRKGIVDEVYHDRYSYETEYVYKVKFPLFDDINKAYSFELFFENQLQESV